VSAKKMSYIEDFLEDEEERQRNLIEELNKIYEE